jgi:hypothetical protein
MDKRTEHLEQLYQLLARLEEIVGGKRLLRDCNGRLGWPQRGVYFFFEPGELRGFNPHQMRVVRVGTHAVSQTSKTTLWHRLSTHRGPSHGAGNHRGSIFRLHVGRALINHSQGVIDILTWGQGQSAPKEIKLTEAEHERRVSQHIGQMPFLWVDVNDAPSSLSERSIIEKNAIALLAGADGRSPLDPPSVDWLGTFSSNQKIRLSGLWNLNYVGEPDKPYPYDPAFLQVLSRNIERMAERMSAVR